MGIIYFTSSKEIKKLVKQNGVDSFIWQIRLICNTAEQARNRECKFLCRVNAAQRNDWFNKSNGNKNFYCTGHSEESKKLMSIARKEKPGHASTKETNEKISKANKGRKMSPEFCKQRSEIAKTIIRSKWTLSEETKEKLSLLRKNKHIPSSMKGKHHSDESKNKISKSNKNRVPWNKGKTGYTKKSLSDQSKQNISNATKGRVPWNKGKTNIYSEDTCAKIGKSSKNRKQKPRTDEWKQKISISNKRAYAKKHNFQFDEITNTIIKPTC